MKLYPEARAITKSMKFRQSTKSGQGGYRTGIWNVEGHWLYLSVKLEKLIDEIPFTIITCILHNICIDIRDVYVDPEHDELDGLPLLPGIG